MLDVSVEIQLTLWQHERAKSVERRTVVTRRRVECQLVTSQMTARCAARDRPPARAVMEFVTGDVCPLSGAESSANWVKPAASDHRPRRNSHHLMRTDGRLQTAEVCTGPAALRLTFWDWRGSAHHPGVVSRQQRHHRAEPPRLPASLYLYCPASQRPTTNKVHSNVRISVYPNYRLIVRLNAAVRDRRKINVKSKILRYRCRAPSSRRYFSTQQLLMDVSWCVSVYLCASLCYFATTVWWNKMNIFAQMPYSTDELVASVSSRLKLSL